MNGPLPPGGPPSMRGSGLPPSPPISITARSSNGGGAYPKQGPESPMPTSPLPPNAGGPPGPNGPGPGPRKYDPRALEAQLAEHHRVLKDYLATSLREDHSYIPHNRARDKLLRLSPIQFQELSTDVYDELLRREDERYARGPDGSAMNVPRFLLPRNNFHPKRNQARQKLSTLAAKKFRELATDVLFELERRFPRFTGAERLAARVGSRPGTSMGMPPGPLGPGMRRPSNASSIGPYSPSLVDNGRPFQSNTMVPNKSMMVEDDDDNSADDDDPYDLERAAARSSRRTTNKSLSIREHPLAGEYQNQIAELEAKIADMESQVQEKDKAVEAERERSSILTENLERQLKSVEGLNGTLQTEIDRLKVDSATDHWRARYESLEQEFHEHRQVSEDVRHSASQSLREMRALVMEVSQRSENEERLANRISTLEAQVEDWKSKHAKTHAHLRSLRASSMGLYIEQPTAPRFASENSLISSAGFVRDTSVAGFQIAVDELLHLSRSDQPDQVLPFMRKVIASVRTVTADVSKSAPQTSVDDSVMRRRKLEAQIAAASNNLISVAKNHALSQGLAPVSLIDAATSHLTLAVIELIKYVKVRPSPTQALEVQDDDDFD